LKDVLLRAVYDKVENTLSIKHGRKLPTRSPPTHEAGNQTLHRGD